PQSQISIDTTGHTSSRSLRMTFRASSRLDSLVASQNINVEPNSSYRIQFYQRTENLASAATPSVMIADEVNGGWLATAEPAPQGTHDWQQATLEFKTRPNTDGISIRFVRGTCGDPKEICPIFGSVWYDDFNLQRVGSPSTPGKNAGSDNR